MADIFGTGRRVLEDLLNPRQPRIRHIDRRPTNRRPTRVGGKPRRDDRTVEWDFLDPYPEQAPDPQEYDQIFDNALDGYVSVTYNLSFAMVHSSVFTSEDPTKVDHVFFASTGEVRQGGRVLDKQTGAFREVEVGEFKSRLVTGVPQSGEAAESWSAVDVQARSTGSLYGVKSLTMRNVVDVTSANPELAAVVEMKMSLTEPSGFSFDKNMRTVAPALGYRGSPARIVWRLDLHFSGYDQGTGEWVERIKIPDPNRRGAFATTATYFVNVITMDTSVTAQGTTYEMSMVPIELISLRPEQIKVDGFGMDVDGTFGDFVSRVGPELSRHVRNKTNGLVDKTFVVKLSDDPAAQALAKEPINIQFMQDERQNKDTNKDGVTRISVGRDMTIIDLIRSALDGLQAVHQAFNRPDDPLKRGPRVMYTIKPSIDFSRAVASSSTNDYNGIEYIYVIEPYYDWNVSNPAAPVEKQDREDRVRAMIQTGGLRRVYNYMFTGENTEVIDLALKLKVFYYDDVVTPFDSVALNRVGVRDTHSSATSERTEREGRQTVQTPAQRYTDAETDQVRSRLGRLPHSDQASVLKPGRLDISPSTSGVSGNRSGDASLEKATYEQGLNKRIYADLVKLEDMQVRGDPTWLFSKYSDGQADRRHSSVSSVIRLNVYAPSQDLYMNPELYDKDPKDSLDASLSGFYQVITVDSKLEDGVFTQSISGARLDLL